MATNTNSILSTILASDSISGIAKQSGVSSKDVSSILSSALPALLKGAGKQSSSSSTAAGFAEALLNHGKKDTSSIASFLQNVDIEDGAKIVGHLLGSKEQEKTTQKVADESGIDVAKVAKVLAIAAPLFMSVLGKKSKQESKKDDNVDLASIAGSLLSNVDVGSVLSSLLKK